MNIEIDQKEIIQTIEHLQKTFENLAVRGLRTIGPQQLSVLESLHEELVRIGSSHLAQRVQAITTCIKNDDPASARALMNAVASLRLFDRLITVEISQAELNKIIEFDEIEPGDNTKVTP